MKVSIPPMSPSWLRRALALKERRNREMSGGVQYFADEYQPVPGKQRSEDEVRVEAERLYGPAQSTRKERDA